MFRSDPGRRGTFATIVATTVAACTGVPNSPAPDPAASLNEMVFDCSVQPILVRQCSYNACHGVTGATGTGAPLRVYSPGKLRATPSMTIDDLIAPLTMDEQHANFESAAAFAWDTTSVDDNWLLRKPLPSSDGGYEHKGGAIWQGGTKDTQYVAIRAWLTNTGSCP